MDYFPLVIKLQNEVIFHLLLVFFLSVLNFLPTQFLERQGKTNIFFQTVNPLYVVEKMVIVQMTVLNSIYFKIKKFISSFARIKKLSILQKQTLSSSMCARKTHFSRISSSMSCLGHHDVDDYYFQLVKQLFEIQVFDWQLGDIFRELRETRLNKDRGR